MQPELKCCHEAREEQGIECIRKGVVMTTGQSGHVRILGDKRLRKVVVLVMTRPRIYSRK